MAERILMLALSPTMEEGTIVQWNKNEGDSVATGDVLCEVETDKATMDYESAQEGIILKLIKKPGDAAAVGDTIGIIGESGEDFSSLLTEIESAPSSTKEETPPKTEVSPEASAGSKKIESAATGTPSAGKAVPVVPPAGAAALAPTGDPSRIKASPLARRLAQERGLDIRLLGGTGPGGRITKRDVDTFVPGTAGAAVVMPTQGPQSFSPVSLGGLEAKTEPVSRTRGVIAKRLAESKFTAPHFYLKVSVEMDSLISSRQQMNKELPQKLGFNAFLMKFIAQSLVKHPGINAGWSGDVIQHFGSADIGIAVAAPGGLITPVVRSCESKGIPQIDAELKQLIEKARDGKLQPEEYTNATFTISNLGSFGIEEFTAIINPPGSAILALGEVKKQPVVGPNDELDIKSIMKMSLSCDHRVIDGAAGAAFLNELKKMMENPIRALF